MKKMLHFFSVLSLFRKDGNGLFWGLGLKENSLFIYYTFLIQSVHHNN